MTAALDWVNCWLCGKAAAQPVETDRGAACEMCADAAGYRYCECCQEHVEAATIGDERTCERCAEQQFELRSNYYGNG